MTLVMEAPAEAVWLHALLAGLLGAVAGSFVSVVAARLPPLLMATPPAGPLAMLSALCWPGSRCHACGAPLPPWLNIPVVAFLLLRGRAACCGAPLAWRYPVLELAGAAIGAGAVVQLGPTGHAVAVAGFLLLLLALAAIDADHGIVPMAWVSAGLWAGLLFSAAGGPVPPVDAIGGAALGFSALSLLRLGYRALCGREGMGGGDPPLAAMIGAWLGWAAMPYVLLLAFGSGTVAALGLAAIGRAGRGTPLPFVPWLALAAVIMALALLPADGGVYRGVPLLL